MTIPEQALVESLQDLAEDLGHPPRQRDYEEFGSHARNTVTNRFGSWAAALRAADLEPDKVPDERFSRVVRERIERIKRGEQA